MKLTYESIARRMDHALLGPTLTLVEVEAGCRLADAYQVASVCVKPHAVPLAVSCLGGSSVEVGTVIGFPHGGTSTATKVFETRTAIAAGATEVDMVINIGDALAGEWRTVRDEIGAVTSAAHGLGAMLKVIFETAYLAEEQKIVLCKICGDLGVDFVKTSTGYALGGATREDISLMRRESPPSVRVKASGGIRDLDAAAGFVELGCDRLGLSRTSEILDELRVRLQLPAIDVPRGTSRLMTEGY